MKTRSELEIYELETLLVIGWGSSAWDNVNLYVVGMLDGVRHTVGRHSELAGELETLRDIAQAHHHAANRAAIRRA